MVSDVKLQLEHAELNKRYPHMLPISEKPFRRDQANLLNPSSTKARKTTLKRVTGVVLWVSIFKDLHVLVVILLTNKYNILFFFYQVIHD